MRNAQDAWSALAAQPGWGPVLDAVAATPGAWIVGGAARDGLLGRLPRELDVTVEGDPSALIAALGVPVVVHPRFGTQAFRLPDGPEVDVVRARAEAYASPGALPDVRPAGLEQDLARRDVSINAIALRGGELRAAPGALADLMAGVVRVLHPASFADDPTRLWRVARYATRLNFAIDAQTAMLAARADPRTASGPRHGNELRLALAEADPVATLAATRMLAPALFPDGFAARDVGAALALLPAEEGRRGLVVLAGACEGVDAGALVAWLDVLAFTAAEREVVAAGSRAVVRAPLLEARTRSQIARAARSAPLEVVALAGGPNARWWIDQGRHVALQITGEDLVAAGVAPGPDLGARLQRALDARLDGEVTSGEEELRVALL